MSMLTGTLGRYIAWHVTRMILLVFGVIFAIIYAIDFGELLRRSGSSSEATVPVVIGLAFLRAPSIAEQILPFAVLFGAMAALLDLTRRLELVVARAAGVSAWQFLAPPIVVALAIGTISVAVYNPVSALMRERANEIEMSLFSRGRSGGDTSLWIRQRSLDGQAILRAERSSEGGVKLGMVTVFVYEPDGRFVERVEAPRATLNQGFWRLEQARVASPQDEPADVGDYLLATNLRPEQVMQSFVAPDAVPFWSLPRVRDQTEAAGLDATGYRLRYQALLARPLLLVAMVFIAASFSLRLFRLGGVARMAAGGVAAGFMLYVATKLIGDLGAAGLLSAPVAAWTPAVIGSMLGSLALLHQEDG